MASNSGRTAISRLMEVVSWHGPSIRHFRHGGAGKEDVLTTEVFQSLDFFPRTHFLAPVLLGCKGLAQPARDLLIDEAESLRIEAHADRFHLRPEEATHHARVAVDPDVVLETPEVLAFVEAKRPASGAKFQREQLAREYLALRREAGSRLCCLILVLGSDPPVRVDGFSGRVDPGRAIAEVLPDLLGRVGSPRDSLEMLMHEIENHLLWTTWSEIESVVDSALKRFNSGDRSVDAAIARTAAPILGCVARHKR